MTYRNSILGGAAVLALAGAMLTTPAFAKTMHHRHHAASTSSDSQEEQTTAQLNQQQMSNPGAMPASSMSGINPNSSAPNSAQLQNGGPSMAPPAPTGTNSATKPTMSGNGGMSSGNNMSNGTTTNGTSTTSNSANPH